MVFYYCHVGEESGSGYTTYGRWTFWRFVDFRMFLGYPSPSLPLRPWRRISCLVCSSSLWLKDIVYSIGNNSHTSLGCKARKEFIPPARPRLPPLSRYPPLSLYTHIPSYACIYMHIPSYTFIYPIYPHILLYTFIYPHTSVVRRCFVGKDHMNLSPTWQY